MDSWFKDSYTIQMVLEDEEGKRFEENYDEMSLSDFEVNYGNIFHKIVSIEIRLKELPENEKTDDGECCRN